MAEKRKAKRMIDADMNSEQLLCYKKWHEILCLDTISLIALVMTFCLSVSQVGAIVRSGNGKQTSAGIRDGRWYLNGRITYRVSFFNPGTFCRR